MGLGALVSIVGGLLFPLGMFVDSPFLLMLVAAVIYSAFRSPIIPMANAMVSSVRDAGDPPGGLPGTDTPGGRVRFLHVGLGLAGS